VHGLVNEELEQWEPFITITIGSDIDYLHDHTAESFGILHS
jgi:hypothetical protein